MQISNFKLSKTYGIPTSGKFIEIYLDIDKVDKIISFGFFQRGFDQMEKGLHLLRESIIGKKIDELEGLSTENELFLDIPTLIFFDLIQEYKGSNVYDDNELICRCFGITSPTIKKILKSNPDLSLQEITDQTNAGGGCTSCGPEIMEIVNSFKINNPIEYVKPLKRYFGLTPTDFIISIDEALSKAFGEKIKIVRLREDFLFLKSNGVGKEEISTFLDQKFSPRFPLTLLLV